MNKSPAFQLYAADFYTDTVSWTATEVGVYFRLLMHEWINGPLPSSMAKLARIAGVDPRNMQKMWSAELANKFITDDAGMYVNIRLESTRDEQRKRTEIQRDKGKSGAEKRWHKDIAPAIAQAQPEDSSSSSSSIYKKKNNKKKVSETPEYTDDFLKWYEQYPVKVAKPKAFEQWQRVKPDLETLLARLKIQAEQRVKGVELNVFIPEWPHPTTYLNQARWEDDFSGILLGNRKTASPSDDLAELNRYLEGES